MYTIYPKKPCIINEKNPPQIIIKPCNLCKYYVKDPQTNQSSCTVFSQINLENGEKQSTPIEIVRYDTDYCGPGGKYFEMMRKSSI